MTGTFLTIEHACVLPEVEQHMGHRTVWQCECGQRYALDHYSNGKLWWVFVRESEWNADENRLKTNSELAKERLEAAIAADETVELHSSLWRKLIGLSK